MTTLNNLPFKTIVFDLDGTLLEGKWRHYHCYANILQEHGFIPIPLEQYWLMKRKRMDRKQQLACSGAEEIYQLFLQQWTSLIESKSYLLFDYLHRNVIDLLMLLERSGTRMILATMRHDKPNLLWQLEHLGLAHFFSDVVMVDNLDGTANKADALCGLIEKQYISEYLWIGDTEIDVYAARQLGMKVAVLSSGLRTEEYLHSLQPDFLSVDLLDLFGCSSFAAIFRT